MEAAELARLLDLRLDTVLRPARATHARAVADLAAELCRSRRLDPERGRAAGLAHDFCRELPKEEQLALAARYRGPCPASARISRRAAHGPAAACLLAEEYGVDDAELLDAVASHTYGRPGMGELAMIVFCADKVEPGRDHVEPAFREGLAALEPRAMLGAVLELSLGWLRSRGKEIAPETLLLYTDVSRTGPAA